MNQKINPWTLGRVDEAKLKGNKYLNPKAPENENQPQIVQETQPSSTQDKISGSYILMPKTNTYALGVHALQEECKKENNQNHPTFKTKSGTNIYRPLTFRETIEARVTDFDTDKDENGKNRSDDDRLRLLKNWITSSTGIAYKTKSTKFKIIPTCEELIMISKDFKDGFIPIDYSKIKGIELDRKNDVYDSSLTKKQAKNHKGWITSIGDDANGRKIYESYVDIIYSIIGEDKKLMTYYLASNSDGSNINNDELRALYVNSRDSNSNAIGSDSLSNDGSFLRVAQRRR